MNKTILSALIASTFAAAPAFAGIAEDIAAMKQRIEQLEAQLAEQQAAIAHQQSHADEAKFGGFAENVTAHGVLELRGFHSEVDGTSNSTSDIEVDTFELGVDAELSDKLSVSTLIEYNADDNDIELSEAFFVYGNDDSLATVTFGLAPLPVAAINDVGWTAPLTDDFFDLTDGMAMVSFGNDLVSADVYTFRTADEGDNINSGGINLAATPTGGLTLGAGYVVDLANNEEDLNTLVTEADDLWRVNALLEVGALALSAEYLEIDGADVDPEFTALNAAYATQIFGAEGALYLGYSEIEESNDDAERTVVGLERVVGSGTTLSAEFVRDEDSAGTDTDTFNVVLVSEF